MFTHHTAELTTVQKEIEYPQVGITIPENFASIYNELVVLPSIDQYDVSSLARGMSNFINLCVKEKVTTIFFLDRNARPAALFFRMLWRLLYPGISYPQIKFISVSTTRDYTLDENLTKELQKRFKEFNKSKVMIADEYTETGVTLIHAHKILSSTYPNATFITSGIFNRKVFWDTANEVLHVIRTAEDDAKLIVRRADLRGRNRRKFISSYFQYFASKISEIGTRVLISELDPKPYIPIRVSTS